MDWESFNRPPCAMTYTVKRGKVQSASCACGRLIAGRGKTAEAAASNHRRAYGPTAPYEIVNA